MSLDLINTGKAIINRRAPDSVRSGANAILGQLSPVKQPQLAYMWEVRFFDPFSSDFASVVSFYAKGTAIPPDHTEVIKRYYCGVEYNYSSRDISPRTIRVTFYDNQNFEVYRFFTRWKQLINQSRANMMGSPETYLSDIQLIMKDTSDILVNEMFTMYECYPTEISEVSLNYSEGSEITFDVLFAYNTKEIS